MRIVFVGAGGVGGYFGARIAQAGLDVSFLLRPASARALRSSGLKVTSPAGDVHLERPQVLDGATPAPAPDVVFFACKAEQLRAAAEFARPLVGARTVAVPLQNGVEGPAILADILPVGCVVGGVSRIFAERAAPGEIVHSGLATPSITIGERLGGMSPRLGRVVGHLANVPGMRIDQSADIWTAMWQKLVLVCSLGAVGAAARAPLGALLAVPETRAFLTSFAREVAAVARSQEAAVTAGFARSQVERYLSLPAGTTASMHRDLERGAPSELGDQLGSVCRYAESAEVATPLLHAVYAILLPGELRARRKLAYENVPPRTAP